MLREVSSKLDQGSKLRGLGQQVGAEVDDLLQQALAMNVEVAALFSRRAKAGERIIGTRVVESLEQQGNIIVEKVIALAVPTTQHVTT